MTQPTFSPPCGPVEGWADGAVVRATGIPYALADRFERPVPTSDWTMRFQAKRWAPACPQLPVPFLDHAIGTTLGDLQEDEACQRLSVTMPADVDADEALPVMVWIHGGAYTNGAGDMSCFDPASLVVEQRVVVVTVTYRLGLFGFLGDGRRRPANLGLLDQIEAFRWVGRNISAFGGDPRRVTAFGQSAGADAVAHLMATEGAETLFRRAIIQSPPLGISKGRGRMSAAMAQAARAVTRDVPPERVVATQPAVARQASHFGLLGLMCFGPQYGCDPLPAERAVEAAWRDVAPKIDVLIGHTVDETRLYLPTLRPSRLWLWMPMLGPFLRWVVVRGTTALVFSRAVRTFARRHARAGGRAHVYVLSWAAPGNPFGSSHAIDIPLILGDRHAWRRASFLDGATWSDLDAHGRQVRKLWADFARGGHMADRGRIEDVLEFRRA